jgi:uncharacterized phiE125 gp8 family phage protein
VAARAPDGQEEAVIAGLCASAIALAEAFCGQALVARAFEEAVAATGAWQRLARLPVAAITAVAALDAAGSAAALPADGYAIDIDADGTGWVRLTRPVAATRLLVSYAAGDAAGWDALPPPVAQGIAMLVAHLFDHRDGDAVPPAAIAALWRPWRRIALVCERRA